MRRYLGIGSLPFLVPGSIRCACEDAMKTRPGARAERCRPPPPASTGWPRNVLLRGPRHARAGLYAHRGEHGVDLASIADDALGLVVDHGLLTVAERLLRVRVDVEFHAIRAGGDEPVGHALH